MPRKQLTTVLEHIRRLVVDGSMADKIDGQLLEILATSQREAAFAVLLRRHGPLVWGLCRRSLRNLHDAEDAFQATFMILVRRAGSIRKHQSLASWLYGVAWRVTKRVKAVAARRQAHEAGVMRMTESLSPEEPKGQEWTDALQEELNRLPEKYRAPLVLCYLQGKTHAAAARELGWPSGSMSKRLARGCELLRQRLCSRGLALPVGLVGTALAENASAITVPPALVEVTLRTMVLGIAGLGTVAKGVSGTAVALADAVLRAMMTAKLKLVGIALAAALLATGAGVLIDPRFAAQALELGQRNQAKPAIHEPSLDLQPRETQRRSQPVLLAESGADPEEQKAGQRAFEALTAAFTGDGRMLAAGSGYRDEGGAVILWDLTTGRRQALRVNRFGIRTVAISPDGQTLAAAGWDEVVRLFDLSSGKERAVLRVREELPAGENVGASELVNAITFSPDGTILASAGGDGQIRLWDVAQARKVRTLSGHIDRVLGVAFFPDGKTVASTSADRTLKFWDVNSGRETGSFLAHDWGAEGLAISPDGQTLATSGLARRGGLVKLWDAMGKKRATLRGHTGAVPTVAFSPDGKKLVSTSGSWPDPEVVGQVKLWDVATGRELFTLPTGHRKGVWSAYFSPDGKTLVTVSRDQTVKLWEVSTWKERLSLSLDDRGGAGISPK